MAIYVSLKEEISQQINLSLPKVGKPFRRLSIIHLKEYDELCTSITRAIVPLTTTKR